MALCHTFEGLIIARIFLGFAEGPSFVNCCHTIADLSRRIVPWCSLLSFNVVSPARPGHKNCSLLQRSDCEYANCNVSRSLALIERVFQVAGWIGSFNLQCICSQNLGAFSGLLAYGIEHMEGIRMHGWQWIVS